MVIQSANAGKHNEISKPDGLLARTLRKYQKECGRSIYQLSKASGIDAAYIWRIMRGERQHVSREIILLLGIALVLEPQELEKVVNVVNELLEAAGSKGIY